MSTFSPSPDPAASGMERWLPLRGTRNLRDVGGYPAGEGRRTRWRTLLRTDVLSRLPPGSQRTLVELGLRQVIDLRFPQELADAPNVFASSRQVRYRSVPLMDDSSHQHGVVATYRHILDTRADALAVVARALLGPDGLPAVIGCTAGVDRTGVTIALLLSAVGVPADVVAGDYGASTEHFSGDGAASGLDDWRAGAVTLDCVPEYMLEALDHLDRKHGGARSLLARRGLGEADLDRLTELLTEPDPALADDRPSAGDPATAA